MCVCVWAGNEGREQGIWGIIPFGCVRGLETSIHPRAPFPCSTRWRYFLSSNQNANTNPHTHTYTHTQLRGPQVGDGTTSVVIVAAELLKRGNELVKNKIHPTSIMSGFRLALKEVCWGGGGAWACHEWACDERGAFDAHG